MLHKTLLRCWYGPRAPAHTLLTRVLLPLSWLFAGLVSLRRWTYRRGLRRITRLPVPVVVVGNLTAGGAGKTPLTLRLVEWLRAAGYSPGILSRGYGGRAREPMSVGPASDAAQVGDEPILLARRAACPVWVGRRRAEVGRRLLACHPEVNVLVADDGLQHYALARDLEIVVLDGARGLGNGRLLPAGPLREPKARLREADAVVVNGAGEASEARGDHFGMRLRAGAFVNLACPTRFASAERFKHGVVHAVAGIGHPERFFATLRDLGLTITPHAFADHHAYVAADLPAGTVLMTEKDAVKCAAFARDDLWYLVVDAELDAGLNRLLMDVLKARDGSKTA